MSVSPPPGGEDLAPLRAMLAASPVTARVRIDHVSLIRLHRDHGVYEWDEQIDVSLV